MGTAFLACREAGIPAAYKAAVRAARDDRTAVTRAFSGRPARRPGQRVRGRPARSGAGDPALSAPERGDPGAGAAAAARGDTRFLSLWAGQAAGLARDLPAADLVAALVREAEQCLGRLATTA